MPGPAADGPGGSSDDDGLASGSFTDAGPTRVTVTWAMTDRDRIECDVDDDDVATAVEVARERLQATYRGVFATTVENDPAFPGVTRVHIHAVFPSGADGELAQDGLARIQQWLDNELRTKTHD